MTILGNRQGQEGQAPQDDDDDGNDDGENRPSDEETRHDAPPYLAVSDTEEVEADESDAVRAVLPDVT